MNQRYFLALLPLTCLLMACSGSGRAVNRTGQPGPATQSAPPSAGAVLDPSMPPAEIAQHFDAQDAWQIVKTLAGPSFQGRHTGTPGELKGAQYVAAAFKAAGLQPGGDNGSYLQTFPVRVEEMADTPVFDLSRSSGDHRSLKLRDDFRPIFGGAGGAGGAGDVQGPGLFVGGSEDLPTLNVSGKILLARPTGSFRSFVTRAHEAGALAVLIPTGATELLKGEGEVPGDGAMPVAELSQSGAVAMLDGSGHTRDELNADAQAGRPVPSFPLNWTVHYALSLKPPATVDAHNVIGVLPGAANASKTIVVGGHYEEIGPDPDGAVYPAANDNASGTATVLELARLLHEASFHPAANIVFVSWSGHEEGLYGSQYYVKHARFPLDKTVLYLNLDTVGQGSGKNLDAYISDNAARTFLYNALGAFTTAGQPAPVTVATEPEGTSDDETFEKSNVTSIALNWSGLDQSSKLHTLGDTAENVDPAKLKVTGEVAGLVLLLAAR